MYCLKGRLFQNLISHGSLNLHYPTYIFWGQTMPKYLSLCQSCHVTQILLAILGINISHYLQNTTLPPYPGCNANYVKHFLSSLSHCTSFSACKKLMWNPPMKILLTEEGSLRLTCETTLSCLTDILGKWSLGYCGSCFQTCSSYHLSLNCNPHSRGIWELISYPLTSTGEEILSFHQRSPQLVLQCVQSLGLLRK